MGKLSIVRVGLALGLVTAIAHAGWSALVWSGKAQGLLDSYFKLHFFANPMQLQEFSMVTAGQLVALGFVSGLVIGAVFAFLWNVLSFGAKPAAKKAPVKGAASSSAAAQAAQ